MLLSCLTMAKTVTLPWLQLWKTWTNVSIWGWLSTILVVVVISHEKPRFPNNQWQHYVPSKWRTVRVLWAADTLGSNGVIRTKQATIHEWLSGCWLRQMQWWSYGPKDDHRSLVYDHWISWQLATYIGRCVNRSKLDRLKWTRRMVKETRQIGFWTCLLQ